MSPSKPEWKKLCTVADIPVRGARRVRRPQGGDVAVFRTADDRVFALLDACPHKGGPLSQGIVHGARVACPLHNWSIGLEDGAAAAPDEGRTAVFAVQRRGDEVWLDAAELRSRAVEPPAALGCGGCVAAPAMAE